VPERPPDLPDFNRPPLIEVALGLQFEPLPQLRQGHVGLFWTEIRDQYPKARDLQPLEPVHETFDEEGPVFTFQISDVPELHRAWFVSEDETLLVQVQSDRLIHNWRQVRGESYPRFEVLYETFAERLRQFEVVLGAAGVPRPVRQQVEVTYINWIDAGWLADFFLPVRHQALELQGIANEADDEGMNLRFPVTEEGGQRSRLYVHVKKVQRRRAEGGLFNSHPEQGFLMSLSYRSPLAATGDPSDVEDSMYRGRNAIVRVFTALTKPEWHETWERST
jgi:uncharacterized protein (TIGR04255 family)